MIVRIEDLNGHHIEVTTEHSASSYGHPVVLVDGHLADVAVEYYPDECNCTPLTLLADQAGICHGGETRRQLRLLAEELYPQAWREDTLTGLEIEHVICEFKRRGEELAKLEENA